MPATVPATVALPAGTKPNPYSVDNVVVDADGGDATDARARALAQGEVTAFKQLITRINPAKAADILSRTPPSRISNMIRGYQVVDEQITPNHYHATLRYNFDPKQADLFVAPVQPAAAPAPAKPAQVEAPADTRPVSKAVLVLPVYNQGGALKLWQDDNQWRDVWYDAALEAGGGLVVAPLGNLDDRVDVDGTNVNDASYTSLARMCKRYGTGQVDIVTAYYDLKADPKPTLEVTIKRILPDKVDTKQMNYILLSTETLDTLLVRASNDIAKTLYKQQTIDPNKIEYARLKEIDARINTSDIREWQDLRQRLLTHTNIVAIKFNSISYYETDMTITFRGTPDMLGKTLVASGLRVFEDGDKLVLSLK